MTQEELVALLDQAKHKQVSIGYNKITLVNRDNFNKSQIDYRVDLVGNNLTGEDYGRWRNEWYVIAFHSAYIYPIFIDTDSHRIYHASMGRMGEWEPGKIAENPEEFFSILETIHSLSVNRHTPQSLKENPLSDSEVENFQKFIESLSSYNDKGFWFSFINKS